MPHVTSKDGTIIAYEQSGQGPALVVVGGVLGDHHQQAGLAALLAEHFTVYNIDRRGHGESGFTAPYAVEREVEDLNALITEAGGSAFVYGTSGPGVLCMEAAARWPLSQNEEARGMGASIHPGRHSTSRTARLHGAACPAVA